jgi:IclR family mhp operon transcriptional activator
MGCDSNIRAISRGIKVLKVINQHGSLSMTSIAALCDLPYPTACRIVETLQDECLIEREGTRKSYRPTALVKTLSSGYQDDDDLARISRPHIVKLTRDLRWPISVCTRVGMNMMIRDSTHTTALYTLSTYHRGYTMPLLGSSSGKVCLAFAEDEDRDDVLKLLGEAKAIGAERTVDRLKAEFEVIRNNGYGSYDRIRHTANPGKTSAISVPILDNNACKGTLTLAFFSSAMSLTSAVESYLPEIKRTAANISDELLAERRHAA